MNEAATNKTSHLLRYDLQQFGSSGFKAPVRMRSLSLSNVCVCACMRVCVSVHMHLYQMHVHH